MLCRRSSPSNIVPWQLAGYAIDVVPLTADGKIDLDAAESLVSERHRVVALAHVSNALGSILDAKRAAEIAHSKGALLLLDGCQAAARIPVDVASSPGLLRFFRSQLYANGIGCLWAGERLD